MSFNRFVAIGMGALLAMGGVVGYLAGAEAAGIPTTNVMTYSGVLTDASGTPLVGQKRIQVSLFNKATPDAAIQCTVGPETKTLIAGGFQTDLTTCANTIKSQPDLWAEVFVDDVSLGRAKIGAVPFALEAGHCTSSDAATAAAGALESRIAALEASLAEARSGLGALFQNGVAGGDYLLAGWTLHTAPGTSRTYSKRVAFEQPFAKVPQVVVGISHLDVDRDFNARVTASATAVDKTGFTLNINTWSDSVIYATTLNWSAFVK